MGSSTLDELRDLSKGWRWGRRPLVPQSAQEQRGDLPSDEFPTDWARTRPFKALRAVLQVIGLRPVTFNAIDADIFGREVLDHMSSPVIFFSNHSSHVDGSLIMSALPAKWRAETAIGAAKDYFFDKWWKAIIMSLIYNAFPIDRARGRGTISTARRLLDEGYSLVIFPEGTRSRDGWMNRFRHGTARMAIETNTPLVPIGIRGANAAMPTGRSWPRPGRPPVTIRFGEPIYPAEGEDHRELSTRMAMAVAELLDEDRATWFESRLRAGRGETEIPMAPTTMPDWRQQWDGSRPLPRRGPRRAWPTGRNR